MVFYFKIFTLFLDVLNFSNLLHLFGAKMIFICSCQIIFNLSNKILNLSNNPLCGLFFKIKNLCPLFAILPSYFQI